MAGRRKRTEAEELSDSKIPETGLLPGPWLRTLHSQHRTQDLESLYEQLDAALLEVHIWFETSGPTLDALLRVRRLVQELSRRGVEHVLEVAFESLAALLTELQLRFHAHVVNELNAGDHQAAQYRLKMPASFVTETLPMLDALTQLLVKVADAHGKYQHVHALAGRPNEHRSRTRRPQLVGDRGTADGGPAGAAAPGSGTPEGERDRPGALRGPVPHMD